jgi:hypothetical protein
MRETSSGGIQRTPLNWSTSAATPTTARPSTIADSQARTENLLRNRRRGGRSTAGDPLRGRDGRTRGFAGGGAGRDALAAGGAGASASSGRRRGTAASWCRAGTAVPPVSLPNGLRLGSGTGLSGRRRDVVMRTVPISIWVQSVTIFSLPPAGAPSTSVPFWGSKS